MSSPGKVLEWLTCPQRRQPQPQHRCKEGRGEGTRTGRLCVPSVNRLQTNRSHERKGLPAASWNWMNLFALQPQRWLLLRRKTMEKHKGDRLSSPRGGSSSGGRIWRSTRGTESIRSPTRCYSENGPWCPAQWTQQF